jgi:hypothetical protein
MSSLLNDFPSSRIIILFAFFCRGDSMAYNDCGLSLQISNKLFILSSVSVSAERQSSKKDKMEDFDDGSSD